MSEEQFNPQEHVKEYKRNCNECKKVWHSLADREEQIQKNIQFNAFQQSANCCRPSAGLQAKRNVEANQSDLDNIKKCPNCGSRNYSEKALIYGKKK